MVYTTGSYVIREVCCEFCDNKLGTDRMKRIMKRWKREMAAEFSAAFEDVFPFVKVGYVSSLQAKP